MKGHAVNTVYGGIDAIAQSVSAPNAFGSSLDTTRPVAGVMPCLPGSWWVEYKQVVSRCVRCGDLLVPTHQPPVCRGSRGGQP